MSKSRLLKYARADHCRLEGNGGHQLAAAFALKIYRSNAIYTFIPKNACSTMRLSLAIANGCIAGPEDFAWIHNNNPTFRASLQDLILADYTFVVLRDPFARLASCFLDKIVSKSLPGAGLNDLTPRAPGPDEVTFTDFVGLLDDPGVLTANPHWRPQTAFLAYDRYDDYFAVEDFKAATAVIAQRAGLAVVDARPLTAHGLDRFALLPESAEHAATPVRELARLQSAGVSPSARGLYTPASIAAVRRLYAADLALYAAKIGRPALF